MKVMTDYLYMYIKTVKSLSVSTSFELGGNFDGVPGSILNPIRSRATLFDDGTRGVSSTSFREGLCLTRKGMRLAFVCLYV